MSRMTLICRESSVYRGGAQLNSPYQFDTRARTARLRGPNVSRKQNPTSRKLYETSLSISGSPLGAKPLPSVCSVCRRPHQQQLKKRKQPYYPLPLVIVSALFKRKVSAAQPPRYIFYLLYKSPR